MLFRSGVGEGGLPDGLLLDLRLEGRSPADLAHGGEGGVGVGGGHQDVAVGVDVVGDHSGGTGGPGSSRCMKRRCPG